MQFLYGTYFPALNFSKCIVVIGMFYLPKKGNWSIWLMDLSKKKKKEYLADGSGECLFLPAILCDAVSNIHNITVFALFSLFL